MRTITVDFSSSTPVQPFYGGEYGENGAVQLNITPPTEMTEDENITVYYVAFKVDDGIMLSETFGTSDEISITLGGSVTEQRKIYFQLIATSADGETVISKSPITLIFLGDSIKGDLIPDPTTGDTIYTQIAELRELIESAVAEIFDLNVDNHSMQRKASALYNLYLSHTKVFKYKGNLVIGATYDGSNVNFYYQESSGVNAGKIFPLKVYANGMYGMSLAVEGNIHWHENKSVLDKFSDNGELLYDGEPIGTGSAFLGTVIGTAIDSDEYADYTAYFYDGSTQLSTDLEEGYFLFQPAVRSGSSLQLRISVNGGTPIEVKELHGTTYASFTAGFFTNYDTAICRYDGTYIIVEALIRSRTYLSSNYYTKQQTYSKTEVDNLISSLSIVSFSIVSVLPQTGQSNIIYLVPAASSETGNIYEEWLYINSAWELIGSTAVDLTGYATESWVQEQGYAEALTDEQMAQATSALVDYVTINGAYFGTDGENIIAF